MHIIYSLLGPSSFWIWRNVLEISIFSFLFYRFSLYLRKDKNSNLLPYFYGYCALGCITYFLQLPTLSVGFLLFGPAALCLFILFHQETLQRNFIAFKQGNLQTIAISDSFETLMRSILIALNNKQEITVLLEYNDQLDDFLACDTLINSPMNHDLLELLFKSPSFDTQKMLWISHTGIIRGINVTWHHESTSKFSTGATQILTSENLHEWYTNKTDCLIFTLDPATRTFTIFAHGMSKKNLSSHHILQMIKKHNLNVSDTKKKEGVVHGKTQKTSHQQRTP